MPKKPEKSNADQVSDPEAFAKLCRKAIAKAIGNEGLGFSLHSRSEGNRTLYTLSGDGATSAEAKYRYSVIPFQEAQSTKLWLAASLEFEFQKLYRLVNVSLLIFEGEALDERKLALLRAEWESPQSNTSASHAQPHWHIYPSRLNRLISDTGSEFKPEEDVQPFVLEDVQIDSRNVLSTELDRLKKFHLAMSARWHVEGSGSHLEEIQLKYVLKWLEGCLSYIRSQLEYVYS
jgi:hypothetical protein